MIWGFFWGLQEHLHSTNRDAVLGKPGVRLFAGMREVPESVPASGVAGAVLTRVAWKERREMYASRASIVAKGTKSRRKCAGKRSGAW